jgi:hypothetical protein
LPGISFTDRCPNGKRVQKYEAHTYQKYLSFDRWTPDFRLLSANRKLIDTLLTLA